MNKEEPLDKVDYKIAQDTLIMVSNMLSVIDWSDFIKAINLAETVGPFYMAPHDFMKASGRTRILAEMATHAKELVKLRNALKETYDEVPT